MANGTKLVQSWEDQYYVVNEYRANAHQVSLKNSCGKITYVKYMLEARFNQSFNLSFCLYLFPFMYSHVCISQHYYYYYLNNVINGS